MSLAEPHVQSVLLGDAVDLAPVAVFVADDEMRYVAVNRYACDVLGYTRDELLDLRVTDIATYPEAAEEYADLVAHRMRAGLARLKRKDGTAITLRYRAGETTVAGLTYYVSVGWPETERA